MEKANLVQYLEDEEETSEAQPLHRPPMGLVQCPRCKGRGAYPDNPKSFIDDIIADPLGDWWAKASPKEKFLAVIAGAVIILLAFFGLSTGMSRITKRR